MKISTFLSSAPAAFKAALSQSQPFLFSGSLGNENTESSNTHPMKKTILKKSTLLLLTLFVLGAMPGMAQYNAVHQFDETNGDYPFSGLTLHNGLFYGTSQVGGGMGYGSIYVLNPTTGAVSNVYSITNTVTQGNQPSGDVTFSGNVMYGLTLLGGANNFGCLFSYDSITNTYTDLVDFSNTSGASPGANPWGSLTLVGNTLYGMTSAGGTNGLGCIFSYTISAPTPYADLYDFTGGTDGANPYGSLTAVGSVLFGMTNLGGANGAGTLFTYTIGGNTVNTVHSFGGSPQGTLVDGANPYGSLTLSGNTLYGATYSDVDNQTGTLFSCNTNGTGYTILYNFPASYTNQGKYPYGDLTISGNLLYGTASGGGTGVDQGYSAGTIFSFNLVTNQYINLVDFTGTGGPNSGAQPYGCLQMLGNVLYGTAAVGGTNDDGVVFDYQVLTASAIQTANISCNGGSNSAATATAIGGASPYTYSWSNGTSTVSTANPTGSVLSAGTYTVTVTDNVGSIATAIVTITQPDALSASTSVITNVPCSGASAGSASASPSGGTSPYNYSWSPSGGSNATANSLSAGDYTVTITDNSGCTATADATISQQQLTINITSSNGTCPGTTDGSASISVSDGVAPLSYAWSPSGGNGSSANSLSVGSYTVTVTDASGCTASTEITILNDQYTDLFNFSPSFVENPYCGFAKSGKAMFATGENGGTNGDGGIFKVDTDGTHYKSLYNFSGTDGSNPVSTMVLSGSTLYGEASTGGANGYGCIFKIDTNGTGYQDIYNFDSINSGNFPNGQLTLQGSTLYGMCTYGGSGGYGTIFAVNTSGSLLWSYSFTETNGDANPYYGSLTLFGTTLYGMTYGYLDPNTSTLYSLGNLFSIQTNGSTYTNLHTFTNYFDSTTDGGEPFGGLALANNILYGTTSYGGIHSGGNIFSYNIGTNLYSDVYDFNNSHGGVGLPAAGLTLSGNILYGSTRFGGNYSISYSGQGGLFSYNLSTSKYVDLVVFDEDVNPVGGYPNGPLTLSGNNIFGLTSAGGLYGPTGYPTDNTSFDYGYGVVFSYSLLQASASVTANACYNESNGSALASGNFGSCTGGTYTYSWAPARRHQCFRHWAISGHLYRNRIGCQRFHRYSECNYYATISPNSKRNGHH